MTTHRYDFSDAPLEQRLSTPTPNHDARQINQILTATLETWLPKLLPGVRKFPLDFRAGDIHGARGSSLSIARTGARRGLWQDRATGQQGDPIALIQASLQLDFPTALETAARIADLPMRPTPASQLQPEDPAAKIAQAIRIFDAARPLPNTLAERYLRERRGITIDLPADLRFHPGLFHWPTKRTFPALVAAIRDRFGSIKGVHRIFLDPATGNKIAHENPRLALGPVSGAALYTDRHATTLAVAEGIETALAFAQLYPAIPAVAATLSTSGLRNFEPPHTVTRLIIAADFDPVNPRTGQRPGTQAAEALRARLKIPAVIMYPDRPHNDFNDQLKGE